MPERAGRNITLDAVRIRLLSGICRSRACAFDFAKPCFAGLNPRYLIPIGGAVVHRIHPLAVRIWQPESIVWFDGMTKVRALGHEQRAASRPETG